MSQNIIRYLLDRVKIESQSGCWEWARWRDKDGYGRTTTPDGVTWCAHRLAYTAFVGEIPKRKLVLHRCDNPPCCNPAHLFIGTTTDNNRDTVTKNRHDSKPGERSNFAKLREHQVNEIRQRVLNGETQRSLCRKYGVSPGAISMIVNRKRWRHLSN